jgi:hypothetical protein
MTTEMQQPGSSSIVGARVVRNIPWLTLGAGVAGGVAALLLQRGDWAKGIFLGAVLGCLNFRWIKRGVGAVLFVQSSGDDGEKPRGSGSATLFVLFRYLLLAGIIYVIFRYIHVPLVSIAVGLCALAAATIAASVWEILAPSE